MKKGLILLNAYSRLAPAQNQAQKLKREFSALGVEACVRKNDEFALQLNSRGEIENGLKNYDFCVYLDKDKYISHMLEKSGVRLFNCHAAIQACDDKMLTAILLSNRGVPMPETIPAPLCYSPSEQINPDRLKTVAKRLGFPLIVKACYGSRGQSVYKAESFENLLALAEELKCLPHLYQRFIAESSGRDVRVIVIGGKVVAAMLRSSQTDFRSNIDLGGKGQKFTPDKNLISLCRRVAKILNLDYCGIDVLLANDGYYICEVNSNAFFDGIEAATGVNVARAYAEYIYGKIYGKRGI